MSSFGKNRPLTSSNPKNKIVRFGLNNAFPECLATDAITGYPIRWLYAANLISRHPGGQRQELHFHLLVKNIAYEKIVEIVWAGKDGIWKQLPAAYAGPLSQHYELWDAREEFNLCTSGGWLPEDIHFAVHYRAGKQDYWDSDEGRNYELCANAGIRLANELPLLNVDPKLRLESGHNCLPITLALHLPGRRKKAFIRWSPDHWRSYFDIPCFFQRRNWNKVFGRGVPNPNRYGAEAWISQISAGNAYRLEYAAACQAEGGPLLWDNNFGRNYFARHERLKVLTLNLHCCQEENQDAKLTRIARTIAELNADIVCLQEVAEPWNDGRGEWSANTANLISQRIGQPYHLHLDWSHRGFDRYRESCAILSRFPFTWTDSRYVSSVRDIFNINARKVVAAQIAVPCIGPVNIYSSHLSWWSAGFAEQFTHLRQWAAEKHGEATSTLLCGDFNVPASSAGYEFATCGGEFEDQYLRGRTRASVEYRGGPSEPNSHRPPLGDGRIDFIFQRRGGRLEAVAARELFTEADYGRVSDHPGYFVEFEPY